ncbi:hypothetical protein [Proteiniborus ethanoligenes]|uniref:hypothetical protein n=1 Tax=Proteiniborus ethanoligenes TaxID=415015 RepID=UPI001FCC8338|nr:hypothetical protein [Proteiniborus ethanoligenes]
MVTKFFLYYLFPENSVVLKASVDEKVCVFCTRWKSNRINELKNILEQDLGTDDERHEVEFLISRLVDDDKNDISITVPSSILVIEKDRQGKKLCEFDGMIIYLNRKNNQVIFLEAKNTTNSPFFAKKCLGDKLKKLNIPFTEDSVEIRNYDAMLKISI